MTDSGTAYEYRVEALVNAGDDAEKAYVTTFQTEWLPRREQAVAAMDRLQEAGFNASIQTREYHYTNDADEVPE